MIYDQDKYSSQSNFESISPLDGLAQKIKRSETAGSYAIDQDGSNSHATLDSITIDTCQIQTPVAFMWCLIIFLVSMSSVMSPYVMTKETTNKFKTVINCVGAGALLGTCFFHLMPEVLEAYLYTENDQMTAIKNCLFYTVLGISFVLIAEQIVTLMIKDDDLNLHCHGPDEHQLTHIAAGDSHSHSHKDFEKNCSHAEEGQNVPVPEYGTPETAAPEDPEAMHNFNEKNIEKSLISNPNGTDLNETKKTDHHCHENVHHHSRVRALILVFSISIHALFEGMALAMQSKGYTSAFRLGVTLIPHKLAVGMTMGFAVKTSKLDNTTQILVLLMWASVTPIGTLFGIGACNAVTGSLVNHINGFALGTFLYVLFFEIAPHEFLGVPSKKDKLLGVKKSLLFLIGVLTIYIMSSSLPHCHSHGNGDDHCSGSEKNFQDANSIYDPQAAKPTKKPVETAIYESYKKAGLEPSIKDKLNNFIQDFISCKEHECHAHGNDLHCELNEDEGRDSCYDQFLNNQVCPTSQVSNRYESVFTEKDLTPVPKVEDTTDEQAYYQWESYLHKTALAKVCLSDKALNQLGLNDEKQDQKIQLYTDCTARVIYNEIFGANKLNSCYEKNVASEGKDYEYTYDNDDYTYDN